MSLRRRIWNVLCMNYHSFFEISKNRSDFSESVQNSIQSVPLDAGGRGHFCFTASCLVPVGSAAGAAASGSGPTAFNFSAWYDAHQTSDAASRATRASAALALRLAARGPSSEDPRTSLCDGGLHRRVAGHLGSRGVLRVGAKCPPSPPPSPPEIPLAGELEHRGDTIFQHGSFSETQSSRARSYRYLFL